MLKSKISTFSYVSSYVLVRIFKEEYGSSFPVLASDQIYRVLLISKAEIPIQSTEVSSPE